MSTNVNTATEDLAFIRSIVDEVGSSYRNMGIVYSWAGILYGLQCLINFVILVTEYPASQSTWLIVGFLPTILFLVINFTYVWRDGKAPFGAGAAKKAINAAFAGAGLANLLLAFVFGIVAYQRNDWSIWFLFPVVVCAGQGAVWFTVTILRRQLWMAVTSAGWFIATAILAICIANPPMFILALGVTLILCMAVPGYFMMNAAKSPSE